MRYKFQLRSIEQYIATSNPLIIRMKEGESCSLPFIELSKENYCYGHTLSKYGDTFEQEVERVIMFRNIKKNDCGVYELHPKHSGWNGVTQLELDVECKYASNLYNKLCH